MYIIASKMDCMLFEEVIDSGLPFLPRVDHFFEQHAVYLVSFDIREDAEPTIEQILMRSVKTTGSLTRGRWMTETQRQVCLLFMSECAEFNNEMYTLMGIKYLTSEQHKASTVARLECDYTD